MRLSSRAHRGLIAWIAPESIQVIRIIGRSGIHSRARAREMSARPEERT
jgi:hypothetical protein